MSNILVINAEGFVSSNENVADLGGFSIAMTDFERATGWNLKPQGLCKDATCVPVLKLDQLTNGSTINLVEFARLTDQNLVSDLKLGVVAFGESASSRSSQMTSLDAPDFTLPDIHGKKVSFSDFNRRKRLLLAWSSW